MTDTQFTSLGLIEPLLRALATEGYTTPTPIQARAIPSLLDRRDLLGLAQTGTGKTAAFTLPILQHLAATKPAGKRPVRALILAPTRELAVQIGQSIATYGRHIDLKHTVILGGVGHGSQIEALRRGVDIVVATPGRLLDHAQAGHMRFEHITHFVLDEADRMFDMGFIKDVRRIIGKLPKERQTMLFSATMPTDIAALAAEILRSPERIEVNPKVVMVEKIEQRVYFVDQGAKRALLDKLLADDSLSRVIVFTRTKHRANRVSQQIERAGISTQALHGNKSQNARQKALDLFKAGKCRVLVATDIAARGIDVDNVSHVINFELPNEPESYVHRVGRTARAGAGGMALSFCAPDERPYLKDIERLIKRQLKIEEAGPLPREAQHEGAGGQAPRREPGRVLRGARGHGRGRDENRQRDGGARGQQHHDRARGTSRGQDAPHRGGRERDGGADAIWSNDGRSEPGRSPRPERRDRQPPRDHAHGHANGHGHQGRRQRESNDTTPVRFGGAPHGHGAGPAQGVRQPHGRTVAPGNSPGVPRRPEIDRKDVRAQDGDRQGRRPTHRRRERSGAVS